MRKHQTTQTEGHSTNYLTRYPQYWWGYKNKESLRNYHYQEEPKDKYKWNAKWYLRWYPGRKSSYVKKDFCIKHNLVNNTWFLNYIKYIIKWQGENSVRGYVEIVLYCLNFSVNLKPPVNQWNSSNDRIYVQHVQSPEIDLRHTGLLRLLFMTL